MSDETVNGEQSAEDALGLGSAVVSAGVWATFVFVACAGGDHMKRFKHSHFLSLVLVALGSIGMLTGCQSQLPAEPIAVKELPLERGYYVLGDACDLASNFSVRLNTGDGINAAQAHCQYTRIEKIGDNTYSVSEECHFIRGGSGERELEITVEDRTSYTLTDGDSTWSARHCPQESLPEPWRSNDISQHLE